jgi:hypothetical protein
VYVLVIAAQVTILVFAVLLTFGVVHKARLLLASYTEAKPLEFGALDAHGSRAGTVLTAAIELALIPVLFVFPRTAVLAAAALMVVYAFALTRLNPDADCGCFGEMIPMSNRLAIWRNALLTAAGLSAFATGLVADLEHHLVSQLTVGVALLVLAVVAGSAHAARILGAANLGVADAFDK